LNQERSEAKSMQALVYTDWDQLEVREVPEPSCGPDEAVIQVAACGICGSELGSFAHRSPRRPPPLVMGHEFSGEVAAVGERVTGLQVGDRVVVNSLVHCGECDLCRREMSHLCRNRQVFGMHRPGAFAERVVVPAHVVFPRPENVSGVQGSLVEPLANGLHVLSLATGGGQGQALPPQDVLILGAGTIGLMCLQAAKVHGAQRVVVTETHPARRAAAEALGAAEVLDPRAVSLPEWARENTEGGFDLCIDAVGAAETKGDSVRAARPGGEVIWIGLHEDESPFNSFDLILAERRVSGSYGATAADLQRAIELFAAGSVRTEPWVETFPLADGAAVFRGALRQELPGVKAVLLP
jgi:2-desacetyl-2-hydroxyethyl bacteriochlorophyllide A dehydrogenase